MVPENDLFALLSDDRCRHVLHELLDREETELRTLSTAVSAREMGVPSADVPPAQIDDMSISLHHHVLPKLAGFECIEYDAGERHIRPRKGIQRVEPYLSQFD